MFTALRKAGATIPIKYLQHMGLDWLPSFEETPEVELRLSEDFFNSSCAYKNYKTTQNMKHIDELATMKFNDNAHAALLLKKLCQESPTVFTYLKTEVICQSRKSPWKL